MNLRSRSKVSAEFSMSSMTDLVFLLLIFFMLTSTLVTSSALDVILPKSKAQSVNKASITVTIDADLKVSVNDAVVPMDQLELQLLSLASQDPERLVILRADESVPTGETVRIMDIAYRNRLKLVLATDPR
ncbi:MAG: biopolymer transporter ExbD [Schleiferiaceae bacterium]|jgi:biopolymer transport protein ExbD|nr:biopolymer transporter ExbD [Schleiferiaceae bacterium]MDP4628886.1 biopolymer transporter ExbD [Schleiferiaceae bacterium]MDP4742799.1 biopolymer transporter ExbD [Schleiferiaceae bacterium]MDP4773501.1 biopolymer transporter ExbD [Schleiferiaceae bacterium]MDP4932330.1 biopolymer transporter ExbD [Schleiferiaceae bacterium]